MLSLFDGVVLVISLEWRMGSSKRDMVCFSKLERLRSSVSRSNAKRGKGEGRNVVFVKYKKVGEELRILALYKSEPDAWWHHCLVGSLSRSLALPPRRYNLHNVGHELNGTPNRRPILRAIAWERLQCFVYRYFDQTKPDKKKKVERAGVGKPYDGSSVAGDSLPCMHGATTNMLAFRFSDPTVDS